MKRNLDYIDVHSHILPGVDDGAENMDIALSMLKCYETQGAQAVIATPHYYHRSNRYRADELKNAFFEFREKVQEAGIGIPIFLGNEILWFEDIIEALETGEVNSLAGSRYLLLEFYPDTGAGTIERAVRRVTERGYCPVIAHYERYQVFHGKEGAGFVREIRRQGAFLQMNYASLQKKEILEALPGYGFANWCRQEVLNGHVSFLGTDAHNLSNRSPELKAATEWIQRKLLPEQQRQLLVDNPEAVLRNDFLAVAEN